MKALIVVAACFVALANARPRKLQAVLFKTPRIIGGGDANIADFPWQVSLRTFDSHNCGGSLLASRGNGQLTYVLTAAHCASPGGDYTIRAGNSNQNDGTEYTVTTVTQHPNWDPSGDGFPNDVCVLTLSAAASGANMAAATLATTATQPAPGSECVMTGWGRTDGFGGPLSTILKRANTTVISNSDCQTRMESCSNCEVNAGHICLHETRRVNGACNGDSGGPLNCGTGFKTHSGVTSWVVNSDENCSREFPNVYARTATYKDWIDQQTT